MKNYLQPVFVTIPKEELDEIKQQLSDMQRLLSERLSSKFADEWIESPEVMKILGVSAKTWQIYRDRRLLPFSQVGRKIYVKRSDLDEFLSRHKVEVDENASCDRRAFINHNRR